MSQEKVYVKCDRSVEVQSQDVYMKDLGTVLCKNKTVCAKLRSLKVFRFQKEGIKRTVISSLRLVELMEETFPNIDVQIIGEVDVLIEWIEVNKYKGWKQWVKIVLVCLVSFFGTGFTIMAYHNDVGINEVFTEVYCMIMGTSPEGLNPLEISYSVGLSAGIMLFFNHVGGRRLTKDPTPIEVAMHNYEVDVDTTLIELAGREGKEVDCFNDSASH